MEVWLETVLFSYWWHSRSVSVGQLWPVHHPLWARSQFCKDLWKDEIWQSNFPPSFVKSLYCIILLAETITLYFVYLGWTIHKGSDIEGFCRAGAAECRDKSTFTFFASPQTHLWCPQGIFWCWDLGDLWQTTPDSSLTSCFTMFYLICKALKKCSLWAMSNHPYSLFREQ